MSLLKFPSPEDMAEQIDKIGSRDLLGIVTILKTLQAGTIYAFGDFLINVARKLELKHETLTPAQLVEAAQALIDHAATLAPRKKQEGGSNESTV